MDNKLISIIIPAYQASETISRTLDSLYHQDYSGPKEIIVVNSSQDKTKEIIEHRFPEVNIIQLQKRVFTGKAKNIGLQRAKGNIIAFIDSDCLAVRSWLSTIINCYRQGYKIVGGSIANANPNKIVSKAEYFLELIQLSPGSRQRQVYLISTANCFIAREIFEKYGLFPTVRKGVDMVFSRYLIERGEKLMFVPELKVSHACTTNFWRYLKKQVLHGEYSLETRKIANLPGSFLANSWLFIPFLPLVRIFFVLKHIFTLEPSLMKDFLFTLPVFLAGDLAWSYGFGKRLLTRLS